MNFTALTLMPTVLVTLFSSTATMPELSSYLTDATSILTWILGQLVNVFVAIWASPIVKVFSVLALVGILGAFVKKWLHI